MSQPPATEVTVHLLLSSSAKTNNEYLSPYAHTVCRILKDRFGITNVIIGSANAPPDSILSICNSNEDSSSSQQTATTLFVVLGPSTSTTSLLETESHYPIISLCPTTQNTGEVALAIAKCCSLSSSQIRSKVKVVVFQEKQSRLVHDAQLRTQSLLYLEAIANRHDQSQVITGDSVDVDGIDKLRGKVRDRYVGSKHLALVTTDRQSGFDRQLALVPYKGAVLNLTSAFWFERTQNIIPNHLIKIPHPNVSIVKKCKPFPIEFVVRYVILYMISLKYFC